jgi:hypothetical protein
LPTIALSLLSFTIFKTVLFLCIMIGSCTHLTLTWQAGITFAGLMMCSVISFPVTYFSSTKICSYCIQVSTWKYLKGNSCMKSGQIWGQLSLAHVYTFQYTLISIHTTQRWTSPSMFECMAVWGLYVCQWNQ